MATPADNAALHAALYPAVAVIRDTAVLTIVESQEAADTVWRMEGSYQIDADLTTYSAAIDIVDADRVPGTNGIRITCPRDGGTVTAVAAGTTNAVANLLFWQSDESGWQHFVVNITLKDTAAAADTDPWDIVIDPMLTDGSPLVAITGPKQPLILKGFTFRRTA
jgi:hypothetical protein